MSELRLLVVEDDEQELATCRDTVARYKDEKQCEVEIVECRNIDEAFKKLEKAIPIIAIQDRVSNRI